MQKTGLFFGPEKGAVHRVAEKIRNAIGAGQIDLIPVAGASAADLEKYRQLIFGISTVGKETWDQELSNTDWSGFFPEISKIDYSNRTIALFGLGDHITYPEHFVNAMGMLAREILKACPGARIVGKVDRSGYEFEESEAVIDGQFIGLPLDEDFESELTDQRIAAWLEQISAEFGFEKNRTA
ncbi:MAG: flavodoxin [Prolixibacteraceae bacterium]